MVWVYEISILSTGEIVKVYSAHCISVFKELCNRNGFAYVKWYGYFDENGIMQKA